jgi:hypothetical protein
LGIKYRYESRWFDLDDVWYAPDFYLPKYKCWIEIKPFTPSFIERMKCKGVAEISEDPTYCFWGLPRPWGGDDGPAYAWIPTSGTETDEDCLYNFLQCDNCEEIYIEFIGLHKGKSIDYKYCHQCGARLCDETLQLTLARHIARLWRFDN